MRTKSIPICEGCEAAILDPVQGVLLRGEVRALTTNEPLIDAEDTAAYHLSCLWRKLVPTGQAPPLAGGSPLTLVPTVQGRGPASPSAPAILPGSPLPPGHLHAKGVDGSPVIARMEPGPMVTGVVVLLLESAPVYETMGPVICRFQRRQERDPQGGGGLCVLEAPDGSPLLAPEGSFMRVQVLSEEMLAHG